MRAPLVVLILLVAVASRAGEIRYFPAGADVSSWAVQHLVAMKEPSLLHEQPVREEYRFLWLRTFHRPIAIRIWADGPGAKMRVVRLSGAGGYDPGHIESDATSPVTAEDWKRFRDFIAKAAFWQAPTKEPQEELGFDGSQWILEGALGDEYHVVDRWTPRGGSYAECCRFLITLSKQQIPRDEFY